MIFMTILSPIAFAKDWQWADSYRTINILYPDVNFQFYLEGDRIDPNSSCANRFDIWKEDANYEAKVALLLLAFQNSNQVRVMFDNSDTGCDTSVKKFRVKNK